MVRQHGSLTRAGKVRNVTPKVEKTFKRKLTGRKKKRILFTRRFINAPVQTQGKVGLNPQKKTTNLN
ncbi:40S ribosomal protein S30/UBIQUITIN-LIKE PROTEIN FUBI [Anaeramoeba ignava]|uniref:40S ribosomal protein S30 n=1 Tax=Anaeramoeba ignava TaxID=1746090 RepID=A0A9Q0LEC7_ANAIG|nr:40S ribosomal protein S30/UBIQUITIN-LIKE PROTEIN FUBI [Anaeramoeba ignava]